MAETNGSSARRDDGVLGSASAGRALSTSPPAASTSKRSKLAHAPDDGPLPALVIPIGPPSSYTVSSSGGIQKPTQIATFSYDEARALHHDNRSLRYYHPPPHRADLNRGLDNFTQRDPSICEHIDSLLVSLMRFARLSEANEHLLRQTNVVTWRGMMTRLCTLLYEERDGFEMNAMLLDDTLYLEDNDRSAAKAASAAAEAVDERRRRFGYYGYAFESYTCHTWRTPDATSDAWDGNVNTNVQWCSVVRTKLGQHRLAIGGEVDAVSAQDGTSPIEMKTSMQIRNARDEERFETKMLRFYMQSFLLGVRKVVVGFRDPRGMLVAHQELDTLSMPRAVRGKPHAWDPNACLQAASDILTAVRSYIRTSMADFTPPSPDEAESSDAYPVFRLLFQPGSAGSPKQISVRRLSADEVLHEVKGGKDDDRVGFLTRDYYSYTRAFDAG